MLVRDLDPDRTVYWAGVNATVAHLRRSCHNIGDSAKEKRASLISGDTRVCRECRGTRWKSKTMRDAQRPYEERISTMLEEMGPEDLGLAPVDER